MVDKKEGIKVATALVNIAYVALSLVLTCPLLYMSENSSTTDITQGYGMSIAVYAIGIIYYFFVNACDEDINPKKYVRIFNVIRASCAVITCILVVLFYTLFTSITIIIWISYATSAVPAIILSFIEAGIAIHDYVT